MAEYLKTADVWTVLDLIVAEFQSDPASVACFDLRLVRRAIELNRAPRHDVDAGLLAAAVIDTRAAYAQYETYSTDELRRLQIAHQIDQANAVTPESIAFGGGRLALIAAVLRKRGVEEETGGR